MRRRYKCSKNLLIVFLILCCIYFYSFAYSALSTTVVIKGNAYARVEKEIRITDFNISNAYGDAVSSFEEYNTNMIKTNVTLPSSSSYVIYKVSITNYGSVEMALASIDGLPSNLKYEFTNYTLGDTLCDTSNKCSLGSVTDLYIKISYNTYNSSNTSYDVNLKFNFQGLLSINYVGIENSGYPTSMVSGDTLTITFNDYYEKVIPYVNGERYNGSFMYENNTLTVYGLEDNVTLMYLDKTYLMDLNNTLAFKDSTYINNIKSVSIVNYIDRNDTDIAVFDLSRNQDGSITGWIDSNYDLYIGLDWPMYTDNLESAFNGMLNVEHMDLRNIDTSQNTSLMNTFLDCQNLIDVDISAWNTSSVITMEGLFYNCYKLHSIDLSNFSTSNVTNMESMFDGCNTLESLDLMTFNTSNVTNMRYMFYNCYNLLEVFICWDWNTSNVTESSSMFYNCVNLTNFDSNSTDVSKANSWYDGGYLDAVSNFCVDEIDYWGVVGWIWRDWIYSKFNTDGYVLDDSGRVFTSNTYEYGLMFYSFDYGTNIFAYGDHELDFNACYGKAYVADAAG